MDLADQDILHDIVKKCVNGDRKAQKELYKKYYSKMMNVCYRYSKNSADAEDLLQDGFVKVFTNLSRYDFNGSLEGWIRRIMVNTAIDFYRKNKNIYFVDEEGDYTLETSKVESADQIYSQFGVDIIMAAIQELSPVYKTVFNMYVIDGYKHKEIAEQLDISEGTSKSNLAKAKNNLREILNNIEKIHYDE
ncbi:RNA polymerase sigma factor [Vicingus serpentipes]|uniref:RNA polymerase sigma factor n=1 Tax=Vicingus serpentipes TaxID=1926625 RepID=A0A5C6RQE2_9FLAO|nr:RNA polymerase sigma factor [Vicingus serpentipes]TXB64387.1 RNA polymerase sigma factor [Vicingus serpentipes]